MTNEEIRIQAIEFAKRNRVRIARELTDIAQYIPDSSPISIFMAGSPGAGKTEFSTTLIEILEKNQKRQIVRIDSDSLRARFPHYTGSNSHLFQGAVSLVVEKIHDAVLRNGQNFLLDGTLANLKKANDNIARSIQKGRRVSVFYIYQKPDVAWRFTQAREKAEGRNIPKEAFIDQFFSAKETVDQISASYGTMIDIFLVKKNFETHKVEAILEVGIGDGKIDNLILEQYTRDELKRIL